MFSKVSSLFFLITNAMSYSVNLYDWLMSTHQDPFDGKFSGYTSEPAYIT